jgi:transcriptional regulator with XRE-family HTH domain
VSNYFDAANSERPEPGQNPGDWIEKQCRALGIHLSQLARDSAVDRTTLFRWRSGQQNPYLGSFERVRSTIRRYWDRIEREAR